MSKGSLFHIKVAKKRSTLNARHFSMKNWPLLYTLPIEERQYREETIDEEGKYRMLKYN